MFVAIDPYSLGGWHLHHGKLFNFIQNLMKHKVNLATYCNKASAMGWHNIYHKTQFDDDDSLGWLNTMWIENSSSKDTIWILIPNVQENTKFFLFMILTSYFKLLYMVFGILINRLHCKCLCHKNNSYTSHGHVKKIF
jgi:hypothetical protein